MFSVQWVKPADGRRGSFIADYNGRSDDVDVLAMGHDESCSLTALYKLARFVREDCARGWSAAREFYAKIPKD